MFFICYNSYIKNNLFLYFNKNSNLTNVKKDNKLQKIKYIKTIIETFVDLINSIINTYYNKEYMKKIKKYFYF